MKVNFSLLQLLSSKLCHDLISPAGSITFSLSLLNEDKSLDNKEALNIAIDSAESLAYKLSYFRMCLGAASLGKGEMALDKTKELLKDLFKEKDIKINFSKEVNATLLTIATSDNLKLILNLFLIVFYTIQRTASIAVYAKDLGDKIGFAVVVKGSGIKLRLDSIQALKGEITEDDVTPSNVHSYFTVLLANHLNAKLDVRDNMQDEVQLAISFNK